MGELTLVNFVRKKHFKCSRVFSGLKKRVYKTDGRPDFQNLGIFRRIKFREFRMLADFQLISEKLIFGKYLQNLRDLQKLICVKINTLKVQNNMDKI